MSKGRIYTAVPIILLLIIVAGIYWWTQLRFIESTDNAYVEADISNISAKVPGYVITTLVTDNEHVKKGQLLAELEPNQYQAKVAQDQANLDSSKAQLQTLAAKIKLQQAIITQASAGVTSNKAEHLMAQQRLKRTQKLKHQDYSSQDDLDEAKAKFDSSIGHLDEANATLSAKQAELAVLNAQLVQSQSQVAQAQAQLKLTQIQLADTQVRAPFSGVIGKRGTMVGQYIQPGQALYSLVPDEAVWITANFKETQIQNIRVGQSVKIKLDAFSDQTFTGTVDSLSPASGSEFSLLPAENATGNFTKIVQRVSVRIRIKSTADNHIVPGLSAVVEIDTSQMGSDNITASNQPASQ